jgi:predicted sulfurtransferase
MKETRLPTGSSDPVSFTCTCRASDSKDGLVLLFYRYFTSSPALPTSSQDLANDPTSLAAFHTALTQKHNLGGKIRVAKEGFNITVGGTKNEVDNYIKECLSHWSFSGLDLDTEEKQKAFFKPTIGGCACAFGGAPASIRVTAEITPMGVTNYIPERWDTIESLSPEEFHERCHKESKPMLLDVRNYYESRIGYFIDPKSGEAALRPPIRRFSQWPQYVKKYMTDSETGDNREGRQILAYCTGGIRCEKGARWMQENMDRREGDRVCTLKGGIAAYLMWMDEEIKHGKKQPQDSLFRGRNYVFDARGSTGLSEETAIDPVSNCHMCGSPSDRLSKCRSQRCHLVLVICDSCESKNPSCCQSCRDLDINEESNAQEAIRSQRPICDCEREREAQLWGAIRQKLPNSQTKKRSQIVLPVDNEINILFKTID